MAARMGVRPSCGAASGSLAGRPVRLTASAVVGTAAPARRYGGGMNDISVGEAIDHLRAELTAARDRAATSGVRFELGDISLEFTVELRREQSGKGSVKAWVVSGEAGTVRAETATHKLAFTLRAVDQDGEGIRIGNNDAPTAGLAGGGGLIR